VTNFLSQKWLRALPIKRYDIRVTTDDAFSSGRTLEHAAYLFADPEIAASVVRRPSRSDGPSFGALRCPGGDTVGPGRDSLSNIQVMPASGNSPDPTQTYCLLTSLHRGSLVAWAKTDETQIEWTEVPQNIWGSVRELNLEASSVTATDGIHFGSVRVFALLDAPRPHPSIDGLAISDAFELGVRGNPEFCGVAGPIARQHLLLGRSSASSMKNALMGGKGPPRNS